MGGGGSPEYGLTWKPWDMLSGPPICAARASGHPTSDSGCSGWPTPNVPNGGRGLPLNVEWKDGTAYSNGRKVQVELEHVAKLTGWPTTKSSDSDNGLRSAEGAIAEWKRKGSGADLPTIAALTGWPTPMAGSPATETHNAAGNTDYSRRVEELARMSAWATPCGRDYRYPNRESFADRGGESRGEQLNNQVVHGGATSASSSAGTERPAGSVLNPAMSRWLMGFPAGRSTPGWDTCSPGWASWATIQRILSDYSARPDGTGSAG